MEANQLVKLLSGQFEDFADAIKSPPAKIAVWDRLAKMPLNSGGMKLVLISQPYTGPHYNKYHGRVRVAVQRFAMERRVILFLPHPFASFLLLEVLKPSSLQAQYLFAQHEKKVADPDWNHEIFARLEPYRDAWGDLSVEVRCALVDASINLTEKTG